MMTWSSLLLVDWKLNEECWWSHGNRTAIRRSFAESSSNGEWSKFGLWLSWAHSFWRGIFDAWKPTFLSLIFTSFKWYVYSLNVAGSSLYLILMVLEMWALWFCHCCNLMLIFYMFYTMFIFRLFCSDWNKKKLCLPERVYIYLVSCFENVWALDVRY